MKKYKIADVVVEMEQSYPETAHWYEPYIYDGNEEPRFSMAANEETVKYYHEEGVDISLAVAENMSLCAKFNRNLIRCYGSYIHSSAMLFDGKVYLFSGPSGVGKTTHTNMWLKRFGDRAVIINDDKPSFRIIDGKCIVYGTPFAGGTDKQINLKGELGALVFLEQAEENSISEMSTKEALRELMSQTPKGITVKASERLLDMYAVIISGYPVYKLCVNMDESAVDTALTILNN